MSLTNRIIISDSSKVTRTGLPWGDFGSRGLPSPWQVPGMMCLTHFSLHDVASGGRYIPGPLSNGDTDAQGAYVACLSRAGSKPYP